MQDSFPIHRRILLERVHSDYRINSKKLRIFRAKSYRYRLQYDQKMGGSYNLMSGNLSRVNLQEKSKIFKIPTQIWGQSNGAGQKYYKNQVRVKSKHIHMYKLPTLQE